MKIPEKKDKSILVVAIGFFLIILATFLIFNRQQSSEDKIKNESDFLESANKFIEERSIDSSELSKKILNESELVIIDIRSRPEFEKEHIGNSRNMQISDLTDLPKDKEYVIVFGEFTASDLSNLGKKLEDSGINDFYFLKGGFSAWKSGYNSTVSEGDPSSFSDQAKVRYVSSDEMNKLIGSEKNIYVIDLRSNSLFKESHIKGSVNIPLNDLENEKNKIPLGKKIILYGDDELGSFKGAVRLYDLGFFNVLALSDNLETWKKKGYETVK